MVERLTIDGASFETVPLDELKDNFSLIENDLFYLKQKAFTDWTIADIYCSLKDNESTLHIIYNEDTYVGFIITQLAEHEFTKERTLHVWASYTKSEYNYKKAGFEFLDSLAETKEASFIEFVSSRVGWSKVAPLYGFDLVSYVYKKEV